MDIANIDKVITDFYDLEKEYESYQYLAEQTMQDMSKKITSLEKKLDNFSGLVSMVNHINSHIQDDNIMSLINDMLIGIIGCTYSTVYSFNDGKSTVEATNSSKLSNPTCERCSLIKLKKHQPFILNNETSIFKNNNKDLPIRSIVATPITLNGNFLGFIVLEHTIYNYFDFEHLMFLSAIANQMAMLLENNKLYKEITYYAEKDTLLNMYNRRYFFDMLRSVVSSKPNKIFGIVMIDIDNFKSLNDTYGHQFGDKVLVSTADTITKYIGDNGLCARYGGEEIVIYLKNVYDYKIMDDYLNKLRIAVQDNIVEFDDVKKNITISMGYSHYTGKTDTMGSVIKRADDLLYKAKNSGKNKLVME
jgi:diguanylate cyclase (GGDEF) domain